MIESVFKIHLQIRKNLLEILESTPFLNLKKVPNGFRNHIFWNVAHAVVTQQILHYRLSGNDLKISDFWVENFKKGTEAGLDFTSSEVDFLKEKLLTTHDDLVKDYHLGIFENFTPYSTSFGVELLNIEEALVFNNTHEALHYGYILSQRKFIK